MYLLHSFTLKFVADISSEKALRDPYATTQKPNTHIGLRGSQLIEV